MKTAKSDVLNAMIVLWSATKIFHAALEDAGPYGWNLIINGKHLCTGKTLREVYDYLQAFTQGAVNTLRELEEQQKEGSRYREVAGLPDVETEGVEGLEAAEKILDHLRQK